jgi:hypothetical protein
MAVRSKTGTGRVEIIPKKKRTRQGNGQHSKPRGTRKLRIGQGR